MNIAVPKETYQNETRIPLVPASAKKLIASSIDVTLETTAGVACGYTDNIYTEAGAHIISDRTSLLSSADVILRLRKPPIDEIQILKKGATHISFLDPFNEKELVAAFAKAGVSAVSMELIPRTTRAQKMDALSSQASLAGYSAVTLAAERLNKIFPMMMTPSGTISPARVFVIGAGVAGLQAIATAKRLGARVEAFDTRSTVAEQVRSLGAKFIEIDVGETSQTKDGYAKQLTNEQLTKQRLGMAKVCANADVVITTALVFGKKAPVIITNDMIAGMQPGSIIIDMAVETGGNVEGSQSDKEIEIHGVRVIGLSNLPGRVAVDASAMYSNNLTNFVLNYWDKSTSSFYLDDRDEILKGCLVTHNGEIVHPLVKERIG